MQSSGANTSIFPILPIAVAIHGLRMSGSNARAGNEA
jgi:hypothetical protein